MVAETVELTYNPETGKYEYQGGGDQGDKGQQLSRGGPLDAVGDFELGSIPLGAAFVGAATAGVGDTAVRIIEPLIPQLGLLNPNMRRAIILGLAAWIVRTDRVSDFLSEPGSRIGSVILALDAVATGLGLDVRTMVSQLLGGIRLPGGQMSAGWELSQGDGFHLHQGFTFDDTGVPARTAQFGV